MTSTAPVGVAAREICLREDMLCNALKKVLLAADMIVGRHRTCAEMVGEMAYRRRFESVPIKKTEHLGQQALACQRPYGAAHGPSAVSDMRRRQACRSSGRYHEQNEKLNRQHQARQQRGCNSFWSTG
jgi:hypothetical protein